MRRTLLMVASIGGLLGSLLQPASAAGPASEAPRSPMQREVAPAAGEFWQTEEGQDLARYMQAVQAGKMTMQDARKEYRQKWYGGADPKAPQAPPLVPIPR